jgi:hypothetical protein
MKDELEKMWEENDLVFRGIGFEVLTPVVMKSTVV